MCDIPALHLLEDQTKAIKTLPNVSDPTLDIDNFNNVVQAVVLGTEELFEKVTNYAIEISNKLETVRVSIKNSSVKIAEGIQERIKKLSVEEQKVNKMRETLPKVAESHKTSYGSSSRGEFSSDGVYSSYRTSVRSTDEEVPKASTSKPKENKKNNNTNKQVMEEVSKLQKLALQQNQLMQAVAKADNIIAKMNENANITISEIDDLKNATNEWVKNLESINEREERLKEEKEEIKRKKKELVEEEKRRKREEAERKKREAEEIKEKQRREKEEKERKKKEEKEAKDRIKKEEKLKRERERAEAEEKKT